MFSILDSEEQELFNQKFKIISNNVHKYGYPNDKLTEEPCIRVKETEQIKVNGKYYKKYMIGFINHHHFHPHVMNFHENGEISHICGNPTNKKQSLCIQGSHMCVETHPTNLERKKCHDYIRKFQKRWNGRKNIETKGTLTVGIVNAEKRNKIHKNDITLQCKHDPPCFINYIKRPRST